MKVTPYQSTSALLMITLDFLIYGITMLSHVDAWIAGTIIGSIVTLASVALSESRAPGVPRHSVVRGLVAAALVAVPLPVLGTAVGLISLLWIASAKRRHSGAV